MQGLRQSIAGVLSIWDNYGGNPLEFLLTRRLNQDGLENLFGVIRMKNGLNEMPDPTQFRMALRQVTATRLLAPGTANCEADGDVLLSALTSVAQRVEGISTEHKVICPVSVMPSASMEPIDAVQANILTYIAGYLLRKGQAKHTCAQCSRELEKPEKAVVYDREILCGLKSYTGQDDTDVGSLLKPTQAFHDVVVRAYEVVQGHGPSIFGARRHPGAAARVLV